MNPQKHLPKTQGELIDTMKKGERLKFLLFWGHHVPANGSISNSCLSQWYPAPFEVGGLHYPTAEHFMMAEKARLFGDLEIESKILQAKKPGQVKILGRTVKNYDDATWTQHRFASVVQGNIAKFNQNTELGVFLKNTKRRILVEASPADRIWGIGLADDDVRAKNPTQWRGPNLLGFALMEAREHILN